jgi:hypothetical protein
VGLTNTHWGGSTVVCLRQHLSDCCAFEYLHSYIVTTAIAHRTASLHYSQPAPPVTPACHHMMLLPYKVQQQHCLLRFQSYKLGSRETSTPLLPRLHHLEQPACTISYPQAGLADAPAQQQTPPSNPQHTHPHQTTNCTHRVCCTTSPANLANITRWGWSLPISASWPCGQAALLPPPLQHLAPQPLRPAAAAPHCLPGCIITAGTASYPQAGLADAPAQQQAP